MQKLLALLVVVLPWPLKRWVLQRFWGYDLAPDAYIGLSYVFPGHLCLGAKARIGHLNVAVHLDRMVCGAHSIIERGNWITGHPTTGPHFRQSVGREPAFLLGEHAAVTKSHIIDCTDRVEIGAFTIVAGYGSQFLTHGINLSASRQDCKPIRVGEYCLVGSRVTLVGGAVLPDRSMLGAGAVLTRAQTAESTLYAGQPAVAKRLLDPEAAYFRRTRGYVD